ncbi:MAG TPA: alkaline phosphatase family protein [Ktedonobacteraceae bacterium]|jgi:predicted AlkP superfamily phosphohydrolase/phosphomutase|nr:alkaline phosphatase family protein [Ktedonobacteraceae bacterium]
MRVFLFGVDGLTYRVLHPMMQRGLLPNFQRLRDQGVEGVLKSTTPPVTPPAWTSIATGLSPSKHGIYDFWEYEQSENGPIPHVMTHRKGGKAIWNVLSDWGKRVVIANVPMTYPPEPVNGIMLSGLMAPEMQANVTYPTALKAELLAEVPKYHIDINPAVSTGQRGDVFVDVLEMTRHRNAMLRLLLKKPWDFFFFVYTGADRIQHLRWDEIMAFHPMAVEYYQMVDEGLGMVLDELGPEDMLMVVSDHGFQGASRKFYLQEYLYRNGWLQMQGSNRTRARLFGMVRSIARSLNIQKPARQIYRRLRHKQIEAMANENHPAILPKIDWSKSRAWVQSTSGELAGYADIFFHDSVTEEEIEELAKALKDLRDPLNDQPLVVEAHREDAFGNGPFAPAQRHLVILSGENTSIYTQLGRTSLWETRGNGRDVSTGIHHADGIVYLYGAGVKKGATIAATHIYQVVPTILTAMGVPLPEDLDGKPMEEPFEKQLAAGVSSGSSELVKQKLKKLAARSS